MPTLSGISEISKTHLAANPILRNCNAEGETTHLFKLLFVAERIPVSVEVQAEKLVTLNDSLEKEWLRSFIAK